VELGSSRAICLSSTKGFRVRSCSLFPPPPPRGRESESSVSSRRSSNCLHPAKNHENEINCCATGDGQEVTDAHSVEQFGAGSGGCCVFYHRKLLITASNCKHKSGARGTHIDTASASLPDNERIKRFLDGNWVFSGVRGVAPIILASISRALPLAFSSFFVRLLKRR
jgi:hypothetical protein